MSVGVLVAVSSGVSVAVGVTVAVGVSVAVGVMVAVGVIVGVTVTVGVLVGVPSCPSPGPLKKPVTEAFATVADLSFFRIAAAVSP